jgi:hypothetical protein
MVSRRPPSANPGESESKRAMLWLWFRFRFLHEGVGFRPLSCSQHEFCSRLRVQSRDFVTGKRIPGLKLDHPSATRPDACARPLRAHRGWQYLHHCRNPPRRHRSSRCDPNRYALSSFRYDLSKLRANGSPEPGVVESTKRFPRQMNTDEVFGTHDSPARGIDARQTDLSNTVSQALPGIRDPGTRS